MNTCSRCSSKLERCCSRGCSRCTSGFRCPRHGKDWTYKTGGGFFGGALSGSGQKCRRCGTKVVNCPHCKGRAGRTCRACGGSGQMCPVHDRSWK